MSLPEIRQVLHRGEPGRTEVIEQRIGWIQAQRHRLEQAERFLTHVVGCRHDLLTRCEDCRDYAATSSAGHPEQVVVDRSTPSDLR